MYIIFVFLNFFLWSTSFPLGKLALETASPLFVTGVRMLIAGGILFLFCLFFKRDQMRIKKEQIVPLLLFAFFAVYLTNALEFWGLQRLSSSRTCLLYSLSPFLAAILSYMQFKEKINLRKFFGLILGLAPPLLGWSFKDSFLFWPELAVFLAVITAVYGWILLRKLCKDGVSALVVNCYAMLIGGALAYIHSLIVSKDFYPVTDNGQFYKSVFLMIVISNLICYNMYGFLLKRFTATFLSFAGLTTPIFTAIFAYFFLGERVTYSFYLSIMVLGLGLYLIYSQELRLGYFQKKDLAPSLARE